MVRMKKREAPIRTTYYLMPGQTMENTKVSERALALILPKSAYNRLQEYAHENDRKALLAEREAKRWAALKQASYEMSKTWEDTAENIQKRRKAELLSRRKLEEADRLEFMKEMAAKNAQERAEVVKQAREMLLYRKPQCRLLNRALLISEVLRERNEQTKFQDSIKGVQEKLDKEFAEHVMRDVEKFNQEDKKRRKARLKELKDHQADILKQIAQNKKRLTKLQESERKSEMEDQKNMKKEIEDIEEKELRDELRKKENLNKMMLEAIEDKRQYEQKLREMDEFQNKNLAIYNEMKREMQRMGKEKARAARREKSRRIECLARKLGERIADKERLLEETDAKKKDEESKRLEEKRKSEEASRLEEQRRKKERARQDMQERMKSHEEEQEKRKLEQDELKLWDTLQRYKRDEFNQQWNEQKRNEERNKRLEYGRMLKRQMAEREMERRKDEIEADDSVQTKEIINKANERVLAYGESIMQQSRGIRPTYPIEKAIENFKRDVGLIPAFNRDDQTEAPQEIRKNRRQKKVVHPPYHNDENAFFFA